MIRPTVGMNVPRSSGDARDGIYVLRGLLICGLVLTAGPGDGALNAAFRTTLPFFAGLVFGSAVAGAEKAGRGVSLRWALHLVVMWLATLSPVMWGNREVLRTCAVSGGLAILVRRGGGTRRLVGAVVAITVVLSGLAASGSPWAQAIEGELRYGVGGGWPRGWVDIVRDVTLFLFGCWSAEGRGIHAAARWRGVAIPFRALGRMPLTTAVVQYVFAVALIRMARPDGDATWLRPALVDGLLIAQLAFAVWWLRNRERGPCEHALHCVHMTHSAIRVAASGLVRSVLMRESRPVA